MEITRKSPFSGKTLTLDLDITKEQIQAWMDGALIQDAFPHLTSDHREFFKTGIHPGEWDEYLGGEEE